MKTMFAFSKKRLITVVLVLVLSLAAAILCGHFVVAAADTGTPTMTAIPTTMGGVTTCAPLLQGDKYQKNIRIEDRVPIYAIQQANGYYSNYMKLRDIAYFLDFDVVWNEADPNVMRLYTNHHYLDPWTEPGPATETKVAVSSSMDIYVDDVKVSGVQPVMIENNNYFKVRDIAKIMDFWCSFTSGTTTGAGYVCLNRNYHYVDEDLVNSGVTVDLQNLGVPSGLYVANITYDPSSLYGGEIGKLSDTPVTYSLRDPWGNYDYTKLYLGCTDEGMNAVAQLMLDRDIIAQNTSGVAQLEPGNKLNPYYRYPMVEFQRKPGVTASVLRYSDLSNGYIGTGVDRADSNFGVNLAIHPIGKIGPDGRAEVGVLSVDYDATGESTQTHDGEFAKAREVTLSSNTVQRILNQMNNMSCDREKVQFLTACVANKMVYAFDSDFDDIRARVPAANDFPANTEFALMPMGESSLIDFAEIGTIWHDNRVYLGVCEDYSCVFENLCNAAGYYYMPIAGDIHVNDAVWIPDEGRWLTFDASAANTYSSHVTANSTDEIIGPGSSYSRSVSKAGILDFFWMMEQIKPGAWLSSDYHLNP